MAKKAKRERTRVGKGRTRISLSLISEISHLSLARGAPAPRGRRRDRARDGARGGAGRARFYNTNKTLLTLENFVGRVTGSRPIERGETRTEGRSRMSGQFWLPFVICPMEFRNLLNSARQITATHPVSSNLTPSPLGSARVRNHRGLKSAGLGQKSSVVNCPSLSFLLEPFFGSARDRQNSVTPFLKERSLYF